MGFASISMEKYIRLHLKSNPEQNEKDVRKHLERALNDYQKGVKCFCGNDIWVVGSAFAGNTCFKCITGEDFPDNDYEIDTAIIKRENNKGRRHINDIDPTKINGFFNDEGYEINTGLIKKPSLCISCVSNNISNAEEDLLCNMNRYDQRNSEDFVCGAYKNAITG